MTREEMIQNVQSLEASGASPADVQAWLNSIPQQVGGPVGGGFSQKSGLPFRDPENPTKGQQRVSQLGERFAPIFMEDTPLLERARMAYLDLPVASLALPFYTLGDIIAEPIAKGIQKVADPLSETQFFKEAAAGRELLEGEGQAEQTFLSEVGPELLGAFTEDLGELTKEERETWWGQVGRDAAELAFWYYGGTAVKPAVAPTIGSIKASVKMGGPRVFGPKLNEDVLKAIPEGTSKRAVEVTAKQTEKVLRKTGLLWDNFKQDLRIINKQRVAQGRKPQTSKEYLTKMTQRGVIPSLDNEFVDIIPALNFIRTEGTRIMTQLDDVLRKHKQQHSLDDLYNEAIRRIQEDPRLVNLVTKSEKQADRFFKEYRKTYPSGIADTLQLNQIKKGLNSQAKAYKGANLKETFTQDTANIIADVIRDLTNNVLKNSNDIRAHNLAKKVGQRYGDLQNYRRTLWRVRGKEYPVSEYIQDLGKAAALGAFGSGAVAVGAGAFTFGAGALFMAAMIAGFGAKTMAALIRRKVFTPRQQQIIKRAFSEHEDIFFEFIKDANPTDRALLTKTFLSKTNEKKSFSDKIRDQLKEASKGPGRTKGGHIKVPWNKPEISKVRGRNLSVEARQALDADLRAADLGPDGDLARNILNQFLDNPGGGGITRTDVAGAIDFLTSGRNKVGKKIRVFRGVSGKETTFKPSERGAFKKFGFSVTRDKKTAKEFGNRVIEGTISPDAKIKQVGRIMNDIEEVITQAKKEGFDALEFSSFDTSGKETFEILILNPNIIK